MLSPVWICCPRTGGFIRNGTLASVATHPLVYATRDAQLEVSWPQRAATPSTVTLTAGGVLRRRSKAQAAAPETLARGPPAAAVSGPGSRGAAPLAPSLPTLPTQSLPGPTPTRHRHPTPTRLQPAPGCSQSQHIRRTSLRASLCPPPTRSGGGAPRPRWSRAARACSLLPWRQ